MLFRSGNWTDYQSHAVRVTNGYTGCIDSNSITILFDFNECAIGVPENISDLSGIIVIHPNPNNGNFEVAVNENISNLTISIFNTQGKKVFNKYLGENIVSGFSKQITTDLPSGIYLVHLKSGNQFLITKVFIDKK